MIRNSCMTTTKMLAAGFPPSSFSQSVRLYTCVRPIVVIESDVEWDQEMDIYSPM